MIKVEGNWFVRAGERIGYFDGNHLVDRSGHRIGSAYDNAVFDTEDHKLAYISGDYLCFTGNTSKVRVEDIDEDIVGGSYTNIQKAAVRVLFGE